VIALIPAFPLVCAEGAITPDASSCTWLRTQADLFVTSRAIVLRASVGQQIKVGGFFEKLG
jgi:hypothetical protein